MANRVGEIVGIYTIIGDGVIGDNNKRYMRECNYCHNIFLRSYGSAKRAKSCRHVGIEGKIISQYSWKNKRIERIFAGMKDRCYNENADSYRWYGAKGIKVCDEWIQNPLMFEEWSINNGYTDSMTIDRIDENKWYSPDNCRWVTSKDNSRYKSTTRMIEVDGVSLTGRDWANKLGISTNKINKYVRQYGMDATAEFIRRVLENPERKKELKHKQSWFDLYMK